LPIGASARAVTVSATVDLPAVVDTSATVQSCTNNPGPFINLQGELVLGGISGRFIFRNNVQGTHTHVEDVTMDVVVIPSGLTIRNNVQGPHIRTDDVTVDVEVLPPGQSIQFPKQPPLGGVGGNPRIYFQLLDGSGNPLSGEYYLGKCVQL